MNVTFCLALCSWSIRCFFCRFYTYHCCCVQQCITCSFLTRATQRSWWLHVPKLPGWLHWKGSCECLMSVEFLNLWNLLHCNKQPSFAHPSVHRPCIIACIGVLSWFSSYHRSCCSGALLLHLSAGFLWSKWLVLRSAHFAVTTWVTCTLLKTSNDTLTGDCCWRKLTFVWH